MNLYRGITQFIHPHPLALLTDMLLNAMSEGHVCIDLQDIMDDEQNELSLYIDGLISHPENAFNEWLGHKEDIKPLIYTDKKLFIQRFYKYECAIVQSIASLISNENTAERKEKLAHIKNHLPEKFISISDPPDWQWIACITAFLQKFTIITGGPGTGKTSTVTRLLYLLLTDNPQLTIKMAAPTGKAAARLKESLQSVRKRFDKDKITADDRISEMIEEIQGSTIHSLLGYIPNSVSFKFNKERKIDADILIIDECSMIDLQLFKKLLDAIDTERTQLILLGDKNQLASVEMGNVFGDLCEMISQKNVFRKDYTEIFAAFDSQLLVSPENKGTSILDDHIIELRKSYRFDENEGIGLLSHAVLNNNTGMIEKIWGAPSPSIHIEQKFNFESIIHDLISEDSYFFEKDIVKSLKKINQFKILTSRNEGALGVNEINKKIEIELSRRNIIKKTGRYYHNQLIIVTHNQPKSGIYNGDIGIIREVMINDKPILLAFFEDVDNSYKTVIPLEIKSCQTAYAMTIHKSQGSEFDHVSIVLPETDIEKLLNKELLYTAITRARKRLSIYGSLELFMNITGRQFIRQSGLKNIFRDIKHPG